MRAQRMRDGCGGGSVPRCQPRVRPYMHTIMCMYMYMYMYVYMYIYIYSIIIYIYIERERDWETCKKSFPAGGRPLEAARGGDLSCCVMLCHDIIMIMCCIIMIGSSSSIVTIVLVFVYVCYDTYVCYVIF